MNFSSIFHQTRDQYCYARNKEELVISILTGYDVKRVFLQWGDPFSAGILGGNEVWSGEEIEIVDVKKLAYHQLWKIVVKPPYKRCKYCFKLQDDVDTWVYVEDEFYKEEQLKEQGKMVQYFIMPWMNESDIGETPDWVENTIWYQIFPDRFCNGNPLINPEYTKEWKHEKVHHLDLYGGDLQGIINQLSYLHDLGINGIYMTPICEARSNHKYDTTDYKKIDPMFGTEETMKELVQKAHSLGIRVMMDGVFNHSGIDFLPWKDVVKNGEKSKYKDWFMVHEFPVSDKKRDTRDGSYYSFAFVSQMPKLNTNNEEVIEFVEDVCEYWVKEYDIDGIRFDVGNEVSHTLLKRLHQSLRKLKPDFYLLGEIWHDSMPWLLGDEYDGVMNYPFTSSVHDFWSDENRTVLQLEQQLNRCMNQYREQNQRAMFHLLDSHDTDRLKTRVGELSKFYQQLALLFTATGSVCIYYGTELALEGGHDPDCRRCMPWKELEQGKYKKPFETMQKLIAMRKQYDDCKSMEIEFVYRTEEESKGRVVHYKKGENLFVLLNCEKNPIVLKDYIDEKTLEKVEPIFAWDFDEKENTLQVGGTFIYRLRNHS